MGDTPDSSYYLRDVTLVLFDTPPVLGLADASLVAEHCEGLMLLVSLNRVDRGLPKESVARIRTSGAPLLGIVTNAIKADKQSDGYGYGGYGYAAYDASAAYSHYAEPDAGESEAGVAQCDKLPAGHPSEKKAMRRAKPRFWKIQLRQQSQKLMRWLDS